MKKLLLYTLVLLGASCTKDAGLTYAGKDRVYFVYNYKYLNQTIEFTKIVYSFGMLPEGKMIDTAKIAVRLLGQPADHDRQYSVSVVADSSTAQAGVHYEAIQPLQTFKAGLFADTLRIVVLRDKLSSSHITEENRRIRLQINDSKDFDKGVVKGSVMNLDINNYLSEPRWWKNYANSGLAYYHPEKWKVLMSFHDTFKKTDVDYPMDVNQISPYITALRNYLANTPTYDKETGARVLIDKLVI